MIYYKLVDFQAALRMKLRISYNCNGNPILEQIELNGLDIDE